MDEDRYRNNITKILVVFSAAFLLLIGYLSYFEIRYGETIISSEHNRRNRDKENEILRGSIFDRNLTLVVDSVRQEDGSQRRVYAKGLDLPYAPVVGYYSSRYGASNIERYYTRELLDAGFLNPIRIVRDIMSTAERKGNSIVLTVDSNLQKAAYDALGSNKGAIAAMNPKTGEILCMVSKPVFNPSTIDRDWENLIKQDEQGPFLNRAVQPGLYPPGSTFKVIVASKALEAIKGIENKTYQCDGDLKINNYILSDFEDEKHGKITLHDALVHSCNITFGQIGMELGFDGLKSGAEDFLFNKKINFDLPVAMSEYPEIDKSRKDSLAQSAIGQYEVTVTPLQMLLATSAIANNGTMMKPYLVKSTADPYGWVLSSNSPEVLANPIKKETADKVKAMMIDVVKRGTGKYAKLNGIEVAGKTGTAEVGEKKAAHSWFIAFAPANDPQIAISIIVENGATTPGKAATLAREILGVYFKK